MKKSWNHTVWGSTVSWPIWGRGTTVVYALLAACPFAIAEDLRREVRESGQRCRASLEVRSEGTSDAPSLVLTLRNCGQEAIVVDRELVFLMTILPLNRDSEPIEGRSKALKAPTHDSNGWRARFTELLPGRSISRTVDLRKGYKYFSYGTGFGEQTTGYELPGGGLETMCWIPPETEIERVLVAYDWPHYGFHPAFRALTGLEMKEVGLFEGPSNTIIVNVRQGGD